MAKRAWILLILAVLARLVSMWFLKADVYFDIIPRSFTGRVLLSQPAWLDLAVPLMIIMLLWPRWSSDRLTLRSTVFAIADAVGLLIFPLLTGLALFVYVQHWFVSLQVNWISLMRWGHFVLAFLAINLMMDTLPVQNRWGRRFVGLLAGLALAVTQDITLTMGTGSYMIMGLISGVGTTLGLAALAFRPLYRQSPWRATAAAIFVGGISCFLVVAAESASYFTFLVPGLALLIGALAIRSRKIWPRWMALAAFVVVSLGLSLGLPHLVPPEVAAGLIENVQQQLDTIRVGTVTVRYGDPRVRDVAVGMAHVLEGANAISQEEFGVSPQADELTIWGIAPGGFYAEFPHSIVGNLASEKYIQLSLDSSYLNSPECSIHFPDPVNAILHEYSHLYGIVPYGPWIMGPEEEGWATYAATRLSLRLFEKYGPGFSGVSYDYAARAKAITKSNLAGHPVAWSHPDEFGGFRLWNALGERDGEPALFLKRWQLTRRNFSRSLLMVNDPDAARRMADGMGRSDFISYGRSEPTEYDQVIAMNDWAYMGGILGIQPDQVQAIYAMRAKQLVMPAVHVPAPAPWAFDFLATVTVILLAVGFRVFGRREQVQQSHTV